MAVGIICSIVLATRGSAVRHVSAVRRVNECATRPGTKVNWIATHTR